MDPNPNVGENNGAGEEAHQSENEVQGGQVNAPLVQGEVAAQGMTLLQWKGAGCDSFDGKGTPSVASSWLDNLEDFMIGLGLPPEKRVLFVPIQLKGTASDWWRGVRAARTPVYGPPTWEVFKQQFNAKYIPESFKQEMSAALDNIQQWNRSVDEYEAEFSKIVHFVDRVKTDEQEKARKFFVGLNQRYREVMGLRPPTDYVTVVEQARGMEMQGRLTAVREGRTGGTNGTGGDHKRSYQEGSGSNQSPTFQEAQAWTVFTSDANAQGADSLNTAFLRRCCYAPSAGARYDMLQVWTRTSCCRVYLLRKLPKLWQVWTQGDRVQGKSRLHHQVAGSRSSFRGVFSRS